MNISEKAREAGRSAVMRKIRAAGIREYGISGNLLADRLERFIDGPVVPTCVAAGLDNQDREHVLLETVRRDPEAVLDGLLIAGYLLSVSDLLVYLPEGEEELVGSLQARVSEVKADITIRTGMIDPRSLQEGFFCHLETLAALHAAVDGSYEPGAYVCVKYRSAEKEQYGELSFVKPGTRLEDLIERDSSEIKAIRIASHLYPPFQPELAITEETVLGDGVITVFDHTCCMVSEALDSLKEGKRACCGKCAFCREGFQQLCTRLTETSLGRGEWSGMEVVVEIGEAMAFSSRCSIGSTGASFALNSFRLFEREYSEHIKARQCAAGVCSAFINVFIAPQRCIGCGDCIEACKENCIEGLPGFIHMIEDLECTKCGRCVEACPEKAIVRTMDQAPAIPDRLTRVGRFKRY